MTDKEEKEFISNPVEAYENVVKQLARKTQEYEELENKIKKLRKNLALEIEITDRYRKALEEIKKVCIEDTREFVDGTTVRYDSLDEILNIINNAKDGKHG